MTHEKALITGGAGFVGSHLAENLLARGYKVEIIDDLSTGNITNIDHLRDNPNFCYTIDTIMNRPLLAEMIDRADVVFHLAAAVGVKLIVESPTRTIETNINGSELVLKLAAKKKKRVLITSTSEVYGKSEDIPFKESGNLVMGSTKNGRWSYACSKAIDEFLALAYHKEKGLPTTIVRLFNTVGPRQTGQYGMVVPTFVTQAIKNEPITVYGEGSQSRCFGYVKDVVDAIVRLAEHPDAVGEVFNLGNPEEITIYQLAERIKAHVGSNSEIVKIPYSEAYEDGFEDMARRVPDITKAKALVGFDPKTKLDKIIASVTRYIEGTLDKHKNVPLVRSGSGSHTVPLRTLGGN